jgi:glycosyltransferase involved in cell wall biosynthesis
MIAPPYLQIPPTGYGGIERVIAVLTEGLVANGHDVTLFAAPGSKTTARLESPLGAPVPLGDPAGVSSELYHVSAAYKAAASFDIVHDHTGLGPALGAVMPAPPVVHTLHGPWTPEGRRLYALLHDRIEIVAISEAQRSANLDISYAGVVHNGIDLALHPFNATKEDFLIFVGRINGEKRPEIAIEIARSAGLPLVMVIKRSEPFEQVYFDQKVAPLLGPDVTVLDEPPHEVKVDLMGRSRAMLFPIDWPEPFGLVMAEALACGTPVIARGLGAVPEVVRDGVTGFICDSVEEMVSAVAASTSLRPKDCRDDAERYFSAAAMVEGYERIYRSALARTGRSKIASGSKDLLLLGGAS